MLPMPLLPLHLLPCHPHLVAYPGTLLVSRLLRVPDARARIGSLCLVDPVALGIYLPNLLRSFIYQLSGGTGGWVAGLRG